MCEFSRLPQGCSLGSFLQEYTGIALQFRPERRIGRITHSVSMRILVASCHSYPARSQPVSRGGLASYRITDVLVKGLAELGHEVFYQVQPGTQALPAGVTLVSDSPPAFDIAHRQVGIHTRRNDYLEPWVRTCHTDLEARGISRSIAESNWIYVSRTLAATYQSPRWVMNGIDPAEFIFSETKQDYFLFAACLDRAMEKGIDIAISLARRVGFRLLIAGSAAQEGVLSRIRDMCAGANVELLGEVQGERRAEIYAGARALIFPTQLNEAFGTVMSECLMSGTPVICSSLGACSEVISPDTGFVCRTDADYLAALDKIDNIIPAVCRQKALAEYHYLRMARDYVGQYEQELGSMA
jgi:glycosyltransferase involved in cell wall biosynthesis